MLSADVHKFCFRKGFSNWFPRSCDNFLFSAVTFISFHQLSLLSPVCLYCVQAALQEKDKQLTGTEMHGIFY